MIFLQIMGVIFTIIILVGGVSSAIIWLDNERCRRVRIDLYSTRIDVLEKTSSFTREDFRAMLTRINELERVNLSEIYGRLRILECEKDQRMKGKEK